MLPRCVVIFIPFPKLSECHKTIDYTIQTYSCFRSSPLKPVERSYVSRINFNASCHWFITNLFYNKKDKENYIFKSNDQFAVSNRICKAWNYISLGWWLLMLNIAYIIINATCGIPQVSIRQWLRIISGNTLTLTICRCIFFLG